MKKLLLGLLFIGLYHPLCAKKQRKTQFFDIFKQSIGRFYSASALALVYKQIFKAPTTSYYSWQLCLFGPFVGSAAITPFCMLIIIKILCKAR